MLSASTWTVSVQVPRFLVSRNLPWGYLNTAAPTAYGAHKTCLLKCMHPHCDQLYALAPSTACIINTGTITVNDSLDLLAEFMGCGDSVAAVTNKVGSSCMHQHQHQHQQQASCVMRQQRLAGCAVHTC